MGAAAAVSVTKAKTKLGGLVRHQCVEATGVDLTPTLCRIDGGKPCLPSCLMNEGNRLVASACVCGRRMFSKLALPPGRNPWDTSNQPQCMCDTCFFYSISLSFHLPPPPERFLLFSSELGTNE